VKENSLAFVGSSTSVSACCSRRSRPFRLLERHHETAWKKAREENTATEKNTEASKDRSMADDDRRGLFDASASGGDDGGRSARSPSRSRSPQRAPRDALDAFLVRMKRTQREREAVTFLSSTVVSSTSTLSLQKKNPKTENRTSSRPTRAQRGREARRRRRLLPRRQRP